MCLICPNDLQFRSRAPIEDSDNAVALAISDIALVHVYKASNLGHGFIVLQNHLARRRVPNTERATIEMPTLATENAIDHYYIMVGMRGCCDGYSPKRGPCANGARLLGLRDTGQGLC